MKRLIAIFAAILASTPVFAKDLTISEVRALPMKSLAERVLGKTGRLMMEVERPPSLPGEITFFSYAFPPGSQYGICASERTALYLDRNGKIEFIAGERRYGVEGSIYTKSDDWTYEQFGALCKAA